MYTPAQVRNWHRREPSMVDVDAGRITVVPNCCLHADANTVQIRIARIVNLSRDDVLTVDLAPDDAVALSSAIRAVVDVVRDPRPYRHPAES